MSDLADIQAALKAGTSIAPSVAVMPDAILPADFGKDKTPTVGMIEKGHVGNGSYQQIDPDLLQAHQEERTTLRQQLKLEAIAEHERLLVEKVTKAAEMRAKLVDHGHKIVHAKQEGVPFTELEMQTLKLAEKNIDNIENRMIGKVGTGEGAGGGDISVVLVNMFAGK